MVIEVGVDCPRYNQQLLVVAIEFLESILAEITRMGLLAMNKQDCAAYLAGIGHNRHVYERQGRCDGKTFIRAERTGMVSALCLVEVHIVLEELRGICRSHLRIAAGMGIGAKD